MLGQPVETWSGRAMPGQSCRDKDRPCLASQLRPGLADQIRAMPDQATLKIIILEISKIQNPPKIPKTSKNLKKH